MAESAIPGFRPAVIHDTTSQPESFTLIYGRQIGQTILSSVPSMAPNLLNVTTESERIAFHGLPYQGSRSAV